MEVEKTQLTDVGGAPEEEEDNDEAHVYEERCFICNQQCYSKPTSPTSAPNHSLTKWALETRESVYEAFGIQVDPSFFQETQGELPICPLCSFTVGRMKVIQKQLQDLQSSYDKIRAEIAFSIVDVVASSGGSKNHLVNLGNKSPTSLLNSFRQCEAECLQQLIFESWHDRNVEDDDFNDKPKTIKDDKSKLNSTTTNGTKVNNSNLPKLERNSSTPPPPPLKPLLNGVNGATKTKQPDNSNSEDSKTKKNSTVRPEDFDVAKLITECIKKSVAGNTKKTNEAVVAAAVADNEDDDDDSNKERLEIVEVATEDEEEDEEAPAKKVTITLSPQFCHEDGYSSAEFINENSDEEMEFDDDEFPPNELEITEWSDASNDHENDHETNGLADDPEYQYEDSSIDNAASPASGGTSVSSRKVCGIRDSLEMQQNEEGLYVCMFCAKTFIHKYPYRDHLKTHTGEGPRCEICHKIFPKNHNLMLHMRTHTGEKPYVCEVCKKGFADKSNLKVHMRVHTGERPYKCEFCDQAFVNSSRLVVHRRLHTGEKPFRCDQCSRQFSTGSQLQAHQKLHVSGKPFACDECGKPYSSATSLQSHKNLYHGV